VLLLVVRSKNLKMSDNFRVGCKRENIEILYRTEIRKMSGGKSSNKSSWKIRKPATPAGSNPAVFMIGARPCTEWLPREI
jgi:hypothetical protein